MLENYDITYKDSANQILIIDKNGLVIESESQLYKNAKGKTIESLHPFFLSITNLLKIENETFNFKCVNLIVDNKNYTVDIELYTNKKEEFAVLVIQDLTNQYIKYQKVAQNRNESEIKSQVLDFNNKLLLEKEAFKDNFIANFSHQVRLPINSIDGFVAQLEESNLEQSQRYNLNIIKNTNGRLKAMVNDIIDISKIEANHFKAYNISYNLTEELNILSNIYKKKCEEKGLQFNIAIDSSCPKYVIADKFRIAQILSNILGNAIKFTNTGSVNLKVNNISKSDKQAKLQFTVKDTGVGIEQTQLKNIFQSFYQISNNTHNDGFGLGLAITKNLVKALKGDISISSKLDLGTTIDVILNFKLDNKQKEQKPIVPKKTTLPNAPTLLIAEPLIKDQNYLLETLLQKQKYNVDLVETGDQVVEALHKKPYDILIMNLKLPTMDGLDTARYIRHSDFNHFNKIPIIVLSTKPSKEEEQYCKNRKINSYVGKPYDKAELIRKINYNIKKKQAQ
ncbi:ATP-binding protein [Lacinutrix sp. MedPE-SW]|uniref:ATP-binding response regulator n=1 Tax=Lacinutrix sp. MedPE-SW TaxID=1860087 RepID=UPI00091C5ECC|nr:ATP-binding protein [Lacinutrix sp. MedPE-SW]OIQ23306.1 MAG: hypothetical protein BM549_04630 [Lacinutrix sp. MedPE-SW]